MNQEWLKQSKSSYVSLMRLIAKKNINDVRVCKDYWEINNILIKNYYCISLIDTFLKSSKICQIFCQAEHFRSLQQTIYNWRI